MPTFEEFTAFVNEKPVATAVIALLSLLGLDRKSTRLNSSHVEISYAVFCLKKKITLIALSSIAPGACAYTAIFRVVPPPLPRTLRSPPPPPLLHLQQDLTCRVLRAAGYPAP